MDAQTDVPVYQSETTNLREEEYGASFFARSVQLKCFQQITANTIGIPVPPATAGAITWLQNAPAGHWNGQYYQSLIPCADRQQSAVRPEHRYRPVQHPRGGAVTDTKLLATAAQIRQQCSDSSIAIPINGYDRGRGIGPMLGRYPGDTYGDLKDPAVLGHPWATVHRQLRPALLRARDVPDTKVHVAARPSPPSSLSFS